MFEMLCKGFDLLADGMYKIFNPRENKPVSKKKEERTIEDIFRDALNDCLFDRHTSRNFDTSEGKLVITIFTNQYYWEVFQYLSDRQAKLDEYVLPLKSGEAWYMNCVQIKNVNAFQSFRELSFVIVCESAEKKYVYQSEEDLKKLFPEGKRVKATDYRRYAKDFERYGCWFDYKKEKLHIRYPDV